MSTVVGRPRGEIATAVVRHLRRVGPLTAREIAEQLQLTVNVAKFTCSRLHGRGEITIDALVYVEGSNRRASRYAAVVHDAGHDTARLPAAFFASLSI